MKTTMKNLTFVAFFVASVNSFGAEIDAEKYDRFYHALVDFSTSIGPVSQMSPVEIVELKKQLTEMATRYLHGGETDFVTIGSQVLTKAAARNELRRLSVLKRRSEDHRRILDLFKATAIANVSTSLSRRNEEESKLTFELNNRSSRVVSEVLFRFNLKRGEDPLTVPAESYLVRVRSTIGANERRKVIGNIERKSERAEQFEGIGELDLKAVEVFDAEGRSIARDDFSDEEYNQWQQLNELQDNFRN